MAGLEYSILNTDDPDTVAQYEKCLFKAFYPPGDPFFERVRNVDTEKKRIRLRIPYSDQDVFIARLGKKVIAGAAINYNCSTTMQLEMLGFSIDKNQNGICEGLAIFNGRSFVDHHPVMFEMGAVMHDRLRRKNIKKTYGTCIQKLLRGYQLLGFRVVASRSLSSTKIYLLEKEVDSEENGFTIAAGRPFRDQ